MSNEEIIRRLPNLICDRTFISALAAELRRSSVGHLQIYRCERNKILVSTATSLLTAGMGRSGTREALQERFGVSRRTAYRLIDEALARGKR